MGDHDYYYGASRHPRPFSSHPAPCLVWRSSVKRYPCMLPPWHTAINGSTLTTAVLLSSWPHYHGARASLSRTTPLLPPLLLSLCSHRVGLPHHEHNAACPAACSLRLEGATTPSTCSLSSQELGRLRQLDLVLLHQELEQARSQRNGDAHDNALHSAKGDHERQPHNDQLGRNTRAYGGGKRAQAVLRGQLGVSPLSWGIWLHGRVLRQPRHLGFPSHIWITRVGRS